jgi:ABC-type polysaccharide/polyol phosphate export permease
VPTEGAPRVAAAREKGGVWFYRSLILNFARRDVRARFKGSLFGLLWSLIVPMASLGIYALVFGTFFTGSEAPVMGNGEDNPFFVWLFTGLVVWNIFSSTLSTAIGTLLATGPLMKKIYFPPYAAVFGSVLATFYQSLIELSVLVVVLLAFVNVGWTWLLLIVWLALFAAFVASVSTFFAVANVYWRDVSHFVGIALQLMFYLTPIIYNLDVVRGTAGSQNRELAANIIQYLPIAAFVEVFRDLVYDLDLGSFRPWATITGYSAGTVLAAIAFYRRKGLDLSEEL